MKNKQVAEILDKVGDILEIMEVRFKPRAYKKAARNVESLSKDIEIVVEEGKLEEIPGVGKSIAGKIKEIVETGSLKYYEKLKKEMPMEMDELLSVPGVGPKTVKLVYKELGVKNLNDLETSAKNNKIQKLEGMGEKSEKDILEGIQFVKKDKGRMLLGHALPIAGYLSEKLKELKESDKVKVAGSLRRRKETVGDLDILVTSSNSRPIMDFFASMENVKKVVSKGGTRTSIRLKSGLEVDLRVVDKKSLGSALMYFTGSKAHNIEVRKIAQSKGYKLNEYGLFKKKNQVAGKTEKEVYKKLGLDYIPPELRENRGEVDAVKKGKLPKLIRLKDIKGDLQCHSKYSDGGNSVEEMADRAKDLGYEYLALTDHVGSLKIAGGMSKKQIVKQMDEIDRLNKKNKKFQILKGAEVNIKADGSLDAEKSVLKELDVVVGSVHSKFKASEKEMTNRICKAMENEYVDILGHPTGRMISKREGYKLNLDRVFEVAKENNVYVEINAYPNRLDLSDINAKAAIESNVKLVINTDAHNADSLLYMSLGVAMARRGWVRKKDVLNTKTWKQLKKALGI